MHLHVEREKVRQHFSQEMGTPESLLLFSCSFRNLGHTHRVCVSLSARSGSQTATVGHVASSPLTTMPQAGP